MRYIYKDADQLLNSLADFVVVRANEAIQQHGRFSFVLSGGSSPKKLFELLASDQYRKQIDWTKVFFFFGDERYVPADHPDSNFLMAKKALFDSLQISPGQIFRMKTELAPEEAALSYEKDLQGYFMNNLVRFDRCSHRVTLSAYNGVTGERIAGKGAIYRQSKDEPDNAYGSLY
jgi:6-phosphogluconolactonase